MSDFTNNKDNSDLIGIIKEMSEFIIYNHNGFTDINDVVDYFYLKYLYNEDVFSFSDD